MFVLNPLESFQRYLVLIVVFVFPVTLRRASAVWTRTCLSIEEEYICLDERGERVLRLKSPGNCSLYRNLTECSSVWLSRYDQLENDPALTSESPAQVTCLTTCLSRSGCRAVYVGPYWECTVVEDLHSESESAYNGRIIIKTDLNQRSDVCPEECSESTTECQVPNCSLCLAPTKCSVCHPGFLPLEDGACTPIRADVAITGCDVPSCLLCSSDFCLLCSPGYSLSSEHRCNSIECSISDCETCFSLERCFHCREGFMPDVNGRCDRSGSTKATEATVAEEATETTATTEHAQAATTAAAASAATASETTTSGETEAAAKTTEMPEVTRADKPATASFVVVTGNGDPSPSESPPVGSGPRTVRPDGRTIHGDAHAETTPATFERSVAPGRRTSTRLVWKTRKEEICIKFSYKDCFQLTIPVCNNKVARHCYVADTEEKVEEEVCQYGWTGENCNIPICSTCRPGEFCTEGSSCKCVGEVSGGQCLSVPCSPEKSCFPGSCKEGHCECPLGFGGEDCSEVEQTPEVKVCVVDYRENGKQGVTKRTSCDSAKDGPATWLSGQGLVRFTVSFRASLPTNLRSYMSTLNNGRRSKFGIADMFVDFRDERNASTRIQCGTANESFPRLDEECRLERTMEISEHGGKLSIVASARLGGYFLEDPPGLGPGPGRDSTDAPRRRKIIRGRYRSEGSTFSLDLKPPRHCYPSCNVYPIYLEDDVTNKPLIEPKFYLWTDDASGIDRYNVKIFRLELDDAAGQLRKAGNVPALHQDLGPRQHLRLSFVCDRPGVYSIELAVLDRVGNAARVRKIFSYHNESLLTVRPGFPVLVGEAAPPLDPNRTDGAFWLTDAERLAGATHLTVSWYARFHSSAVFDVELSKPVERWRADGMDDVRFRLCGSGRKSAEPSPRLYDGIQFFQLDYRLRRNGSEPDSGSGSGSRAGSGSGSYDGHATIFAAFTSYKVPVRGLRPGDVVWLNLSCYDAAGGLVLESYHVIVDTTPPEVVGLANDGSLGKGGLRITVEAVDYESGVKGGNYSYVDTRDRTSLDHGEFAAEPCRKGDPGCSCTTSGHCYGSLMTFGVDRCPCSCRSTEHYAVYVRVFNRAGLASEPVEIQV